MQSRCEFSLEHYREILETALSGHRILRLCDQAAGAAGERVIFLRHDIDFFIEPAVRMAELERQLGVVSTYCVLFHSSTYNPGEPATLHAVRSIMEMGHEVALHYDLRVFEEAGIPPAEGIAREADFLGALIGTEVRTVAQHRPALHGQFRGVAGRYVDAYSEALTKQILYISDSRRRWRSGCVHEQLDSTPSMQLLIHPEWWGEDGSDGARAIIGGMLEARVKSIGDTIEEYLSSIEERR